MEAIIKNILYLENDERITLAINYSNRQGKIQNMVDIFFSSREKTATNATYGFIPRDFDKKSREPK